MKYSKWAQAKQSYPSQMILINMLKEENKNGKYDDGMLKRLESNNMLLNY